MARLSWLEHARTKPLGGRPLLGVAAAVWIGGALYCSGYESLASGIDNWPGSLVWSAVAVLPWLALFEWTKSETGQRLSIGRIAALFAAVAVASVAAEVAVNLLEGSMPSPIALLVLRRLPAIGISLLLILWSRAGSRAENEGLAADDLSVLAPSIDWVAAADNYVELHVGGRVNMRRMTMREAERSLADRGFARIHRRYLVNRERIRSVHLNGRRIVILDCGRELPVGRAYESNLSAAA